jgi:hypothetical protein
MAFPGTFEGMAVKLAETAASGEKNIPEFLTNAQNLMLATAGIGGVVMWGIMHAAFVRPFILVGVLRNYIESGKNERISSADYAELDKKSKKFAKLHAGEA